MNKRNRLLPSWGVRMWEKSTLFNVLAGDMISIVKRYSGVTRDRIHADCTWLDKAFTLTQEVFYRPRRSCLARIG